MKNYDNLTEITIKTENGETLLEYFANTIPRMTEVIKINSKIYRVYDITHCIVEMPDKQLGTYVEIRVQYLRKEV